ncbi:MAG: hypothetical protein AB7R55_10525 [Gemmatimonadales bacterium]
MRLAAALLLVSLAVVGCDEGLGPGSSLYSSYFLSTIDGQLLPAPDDEVPEGAVVVAATLSFPRAGRARDGETALAGYIRRIRLADQTEQEVRIDLNYRVTDGELTIDLCPPLAFCLVPTLLVGPADRDELLLTHYLANAPGSIYRFFAALPD